MFNASVLPDLLATLPSSSLTFLFPSTPKFLVLSNRIVPVSILALSSESHFSPPPVVKRVSLTMNVLPKMHSVVRELDCGLHPALIEALHFTFLLSGNKTNISLVLTKHFHLHEPLGEICPFYRCGTRSSERLSELSKAT